MYQIKNRIYLKFDKTQKSAVCNYLRALAKQGVSAGEYTSEAILNKFIEDEKYYLELNASRFPFLADCIDDVLQSDAVFRRKNRGIALLLRISSASIGSNVGDPEGDAQTGVKSRYVELHSILVCIPE